MKKDKMTQQTTNSQPLPFQGQKWLVEERDACGVGFIAYKDGRAAHSTVTQAVTALGCMEHRGGCSADRDTGDGSGIMASLPVKLFEQWFESQGKTMPAPETWGVGMVFMNPEEAKYQEQKSLVEATATKYGLTVEGWRSVPVNPEVLGVQAKENQPFIEQVVVSGPEGLTGDKLDRLLYIVRSEIGKELDDFFYICSFSCRTIVYKGMVRASILAEFYQDLTNPDYEATFAVYHRRFSTNTMPKWPLAQPMRMLGHNGEINTLIGNINWMASREHNLGLEGWSEEQLEALTPIVNNDNSDSYNLDSVLELLVRTGRSPLEAAMILVPEAYKNQPDLKDHPEITDFYDFYSGLQEPWDGPALLAFSDGKIVAACLDRNGLRPARYAVTEDGLVLVSSEAGVVDVDSATIIEKGRLGPGQMVAVDLVNQTMVTNWDIKQQIAQAQPYGEWLKAHGQKLSRESFGTELSFATEEVLKLQTAYGYNAEDVEMVIQSMAINGKEPTFCMGDDIPLAVLSDKPRLLYDYFKQRFAQVTNPPIDPLRESLVMSLAMKLGKRGNILDVKPEDARQIAINSPVINDAELGKIKDSGLNVISLSTLFPVADGPDGLALALDRLCAEAEAAVKSGAEIILLTERAESNLDESNTYIPPLLAVGSVHHHLIKQSLRLEVSLVVDTAQCWSTHHFACLVGYGASAICPYLTLETVRQWWHSSKTQKLMELGKLPSMSLEEAQINYRKSIEAGLLKILSKMGISLLSSYHGA